MFKVVDVESFRWPVIVHVPQDGGTFAKRTFTGEFAALPQDDIDDALEDLHDGTLDANFANRVLVGWPAGQVQASDGSEMPYSDENKIKLLRMSYVRNGVVDAFFDAVSGGGAKRKNLKK